MKIIAISQRGKKRDFFDLYWICQNIESLSEIIARIHTQYTMHQNLIHILKSLVYFEDAESDPEPEIYFNANWETVKNFFITEIPIITYKLLKYSAGLDGKQLFPSMSKDLRYLRSNIIIFIFGNNLK